MSNKQLIILTNSLKNGGAEKQCAILARCFSDDLKVRIIVYYGDQLDNRVTNILNETKVEIVYLVSSHFYKIWWIYKHFRLNKNAIVISYLATTNLLNGIIGIIAGVKSRIGGVRSSKLAPFKRVLQRFNHNFLLNLTIVNSSVGYNYLVNNGFKKDKLKLIYNAIIINEKPLLRDSTKMNINIITIARFVNAKDYLTALEVIRKLKGDIELKDYRIKYMIVGYGELEAFIRNYINEHGLNENVEMIVNPSDMSALLANSDIYLSTSTLEGVSNSILEAMEYSMPIVATNAGDSFKLVESGNNGFLTEIKDVKEITKAVKSLIVNGKLRINYGLNSYKILNERFSLNIFKENYNKILNNG